ncbi:Pkinase-domain-containing protein [Hesseltinella vesiculosa]|uniref:non-specific serine/threonine protein kinase n=1 Tax=Hesseltinella vesiculosa TaxID=101127 RepID=A0A1X2GI65_9FUNG|nr:Pkinase-domain-containing protein [Hesseltinella vesiculosa]
MDNHLSGTLTLDIHKTNINLDGSVESTMDDIPLHMPDGLLRLREPEQPNESRVISHTTFPDDRLSTVQDSLHSFCFTSSLSSDLVALRKRVMTRSMDFMKHSFIGWRPADDDQRRPKTKSMSCSRPSQLKQSTSSQTSSKSRRRRSLPGGGDLLFSMTPATPRPDQPSTNTSPRALSSSSSSSTADTSIATLAQSTLLEDKPLLTSPDLSKDWPQDEELSHQPSFALFPPPALHNLTRVLPHQQAILTTHDDWNIILSNNIASIVFGGPKHQSPTSMVGRSVLSYIDTSFRPRLQAMIHERRQQLLDKSEDTADGMVLVCGNVLPIVKEGGAKSAASLWLKEKQNESGSSVYIWIFEEVFETITHVSIDAQGLICYIDRGVQTLLDYLPGALMGQPIGALIPSLAKQHDAWKSINEKKYYGCRSRLEAHLPIIAKLFDGTTNEPLTMADLDRKVLQPGSFFTVRMTSIPMIAGLVTVRQDGLIDGCNDVFVKYMFGYGQEELAGKKNIADLLPQFPLLLDSLRRDDLLQHGIIINNLICRKLISDAQPAPHTPSPGHQRRLTLTPNGLPLPTLVAIHRDGTYFEIQLQLKLVDETDQDGLCALWITFDRDTTFGRVGHKVDGPALELQQHDGLGLPTAKRQESIVMAMQVAQSPPADSPKPTIHPLPLSPRLPIAIPKTTTHTTKDHASSVQDSAPFGRSSSVSRTSSACDTNMVTSCVTSAAVAQPQPPSSLSSSPRIITSFSRPVFATSSTNSPSSPSTPTSPSSVISYHRPRAFSSASSIMGEYSAQTRNASIDDYEILEEIGQGAYGMVKLAVKKEDDTRQKVVIKYVIKSRILVDCWIRDRKLGMVPAEIHILHTLRKIPHDNCGDMVDYFEDDDYYYIVMALHGAGMDLFDYIELKDTMHESEIRSIFKQIALAVQHLHTNGITHRDVKDENVVLDHNGRIRLIDFGSAAYVKKGRRYDTFVGTLDYAAPEILKGHTYEGPPQDVWALGILLYTLIYRENPFYDIDEILERELRMPFLLVDGLSMDLIKKMLERDVSKRWTIDQVLQHDWLLELD